MAALEGRDELAGALDAILRQHRQVIEQALEPLEEETEVDAIVQQFQSRLQHLTQQEPTFWQLQIIEFISDVWRAQLSKPLADQEIDGREVDSWSQSNDAGGKSDDVKLTMASLVARIDAEVERWMLLLDKCGRNKLHTRCKDGIIGHGGMDNCTRDTEASASLSTALQYLDEFWELLTPNAAALELSPNGRDDGEDEHLIKHNAVMSGGAFESITFDELSDDCGSARMGPSLEDLPSIFTRLNSTHPAERSAALAELVTIPILEIVHCHMHFKTLCSSVCGLFLYDEVQHEAMALICEILRHVEDPTAFMEIYCIILDFVGTQFSLGTMNISQKNLLESDSDTLIIINVYRFLLLMIARLPYHWIHFSSVPLSGILYSTFRFFFMAEWFHRWIQKVPSQDQLFAALDESGFTNELMHHLSRLRPLDLCKSQNDAIDATEKQFIQHVVSILSYILEDSRGQSMIGSWRRQQAHEYQKHRSVDWFIFNQIEMKSREHENDRIYHVSRPSIKNIEDVPVLEDCSPLGSHALPASILTIVAIFTTHNTDGFEKWERSVLSSVTKYIHSSELFGGENTALLDLVHGMWDLRISPKANSSFIVDLLHVEWFPFREWVSPGQIVQLTLSMLRVLLEKNAQIEYLVRERSLQLLLVVLKAYHHTSNVSHTWIKKMARTIKMCMTNWIDMETLDVARTPYRCHQKFLLLHMGNLGYSPQMMTSLLELGIVYDIGALYQTCVSLMKVELQHNLLECMISMCSSTHALREFCVSGVIDFYVKGLLDEIKNIPTWSIRKSAFLLRLLCVPRVASMVLTHDYLQHVVESLILDLSVRLDTSLALNSPPEECPHALIPHFQLLTLLQCCLGTQYAVRSFQKYGHCPSSWQTIVLKTLRDHDTLCCSSTSAEDMCCVGFHLALSLTASIPSVLICSPILVDDSISVQNRITGSRGKYHQAHLHEFEAGSCFNAWEDVDQTQTSINMHAEVTSCTKSLLLDEILQSINASQGEPDIIALSQASWELISDMEKLAMTNGQSFLQITMVFGRLLNEVIRSKQKRSSNSSKPTTDAKTAEFFPSDVQIKVMNQLYKSYCRHLGLKCSPTKLHFLVKSFGKRAMDCFPVTALIILDQINGDEQTILDFLTGIPNCHLLWPSQANDSMDITKYEVSPLAVIAEAAEMILEIEFPHILQSITRCHCTLLTMVLRWQSQCFWNYLDWDNIVVYMYLSVLYGAEFQVYAVVIMLKHLELPMLEIGNRYPAQSTGAFLELVRRPMTNFRFSPWRTLFSHLRNNYHDIVTRCLSNTS